MTQFSDAALADLKSRHPCHEIAARWVKLRRKGKGWVGPCPLCSRDRDKKSATKFEIKADERWMCAGCGEGGDVIELVRKVEGKTFAEAVESLGGAFEPDPIEAAKRKAAADQKRTEQEKASAQFRERERETLYEMWKRARPAAGTSADQYLRLRGLAGAPMEKLRCIEGMPYYASGKRDAEVVHRGPAMLAAFTKGGKFAGLHITWLDLKADNGKVALTVEGEALPAKKMRGSKAGAAIELVASPFNVTDTLIIGEGIETTLSVWCALEAAGRTLSGIAFWAAGDLGNLGGRAAETMTHPTPVTGRARRVPGPTPDLSSPSIAIPESVTEVIILGDADSDPFTTRCALARACARFAKAGRTVRVAFPPQGSDFNDIWRTTRDAAAVCALIDAAAPLTAEDVTAAAPPRASAAGARQDDGAGVAGGDVVLPAPSVAAGSANPPGGPPFDDAPLPDPPAGGRFSAGDENGQPTRRKTTRPGARSANRARWSGPPRKYDDDDDGGLDRWLAKFPLTELGLIERYVQRWKGRLLFCPSMGWFAWDGRRWVRDGADGRAIAAGHDTVRAIQDEAEAMRGTPEDVIGTREVSSGRGKDKVTEEVEILLSDLLAEFGRDSETKAKMSLHKDAAPYLSVEVDQLDADPFAINIMNGTLIVRRTPDEPLPATWQRVGRHIRLKPHDPEDRITKLMPVAFDPRAACPQYDAFMDVVQPDAAVQAFLDDWDGYSLTGDASEQKLVFHHGTGKNGKSTYIATRLAIVGDYGKSIPIETFVNEGKARSAGQASPDLAMLRRVRMLVASEPEKGWRLNEALIKSLTGGDELPVRELHRPYFMLKPEFKLTIGGNFKPNIGGGEAESGIWRRVVLVPWAVKIAKAKMDPHLVDKLKAEVSGILNRWLKGLTRWLERGLMLPKEVTDATEQFREDSDPLGRFMTVCTVPDDGGRVQATQVYQLFVAWMRANSETGRHDWTPTGFGRAMSERGYIRVKSDLTYWCNFKLVKSINDFVDNEGKPLTASGEAPKRDGRAGDDDDVPL